MSNIAHISPKIRESACSMRLAFLARQRATIQPTSLPD